MKKHSNKIILIVIVLIAAILRLWNIGAVPASPDWDEASLAYNSYSVMHTGKDEYGKFLTLVLQSFNDYKPALYIYLAMPTIALFGLTPLAIRLPAVIIGILTVLATYFLAKELFKDHKPLAISHNLLDIPIIATALLAISPWHIQFSRVAFEAGVGMAFNLFAALFFLKGLKKPKFLMLSIIFMSLNLYVYQSEKLFTPLLALALIIIYRKQLFTLPKKILIISLCTGVILSLPMIQSTKAVFARAQGVSILSQATPAIKENQQRLLRDKQNHDLLGQLVDNRRIVQGREVLSGYLSHFDLNWLFITGDQPRHHAPGMGLLYLWELPFLLIGLYQLFFLKENKNTKLLVFSWLLLAPVPAAFTFDVPHAVRTLNFLPTFQIIIAIGILSFISYTTNNKNKIAKLKYPIFAITLLLCIGNFYYYLNQYFVQLNYFTSQDWQYGYKQVINQIQQNPTQYKKIIVSNQVPLDQSYIFFLFYLKYDPATYQQTSHSPDNHNFANFEFRPINWGQEQKSHDILYIGSPKDFPTDTTTIKTINYLNGKPAIEMVEG